MPAETENELPVVEYKKILYATDLSEAGRHAFPYAAAIARRFQSKLTVFHVLESRDFEKYLVGYIDEQTWSEISKQNLKEAKQLLVSRKRDGTEIKDEVDQFCKDTLAKQSDQPLISYDIKISAGEVVEQLLSEVEGGDYDLLIVSKHGHRTSIKDAVMGDTARRIMRRCPIPVMVVPLKD